jgi:peptide-methionine (S)-S-oxide reductase
MNERSVKTATFGGGCFWCLEPIFEELEGVESVVVGYAGGSTDNPTYGEVGRGNTGHAEVIQITFDSQAFPFADLLRVFFSVHDPTTLNRQGADVGPQYRSLILYHDPEQESTTRAIIESLDAEEIYSSPIVTEVKSFEAFFEAEEYHQDYYEKNPNAGYCTAVISPKMHKFRERYVERLKKQTPELN